ncbi:phosphatase PAP2 family protein [Lysobacter sp. K5869]|uniref:phosphatase PAP2 family protein n=1 Tax=Lysobacter sp. K5869 TaxID=2820808 RepID=UPI002101531B|nr:phosphatase PAP2 family protein [Lysobacter sp. K5869]
MSEPSRADDASARSEEARAAQPRGTGDNALKQEARFGAALLRRHGWSLLLAFAGLLLPLWGFAELAEDIHRQEALVFDVPVLQYAHGLSRASLDALFTLVSKLGYQWGVVPFDLVLVLALTALRRFREASFAALALGGSGLLNIAAKQFFARERPSLWESIAPEHNYSFPSGHAMGSMTLAVVLILLYWPTRWRWAAIGLMVPFTLLVGFSRLYLGVHYPSDILAGWAVATAWVVAVYLLVYGSALRPWGRAEN